MPTYEFICEKCGGTFDIRATIQEKDKGLQPDCPECGYQETHQVISGGLYFRAGGEPSFNSPCCSPNSGPGCCG